MQSSTRYRTFFLFQLRLIRDEAPKRCRLVPVNPRIKMQNEVGGLDVFGLSTQQERLRVPAAVLMEFD